MVLGFSPVFLPRYFQHAHFIPIVDVDKEFFNDWGGRGYDNFVSGKVIKTTSSGDRTT